MILLRPPDFDLSLVPRSARGAPVPEPTDPPTVGDSVPCTVLCRDLALYGSGMVAPAAFARLLAPSPDFVPFSMATVASSARAGTLSPIMLSASVRHRFEPDAQTLTVVWEYGANAGPSVYASFGVVLAASGEVTFFYVTAPPAHLETHLASPLHVAIADERFVQAIDVAGVTANTSIVLKPVPRCASELSCGGCTAHARCGWCHAYATCFEKALRDEVGCPHGPTAWYTDDCPILEPDRLYLPIVISSLLVLLSISVATGCCSKLRSCLRPSAAVRQAPEPAADGGSGADDGDDAVEMVAVDE
ncbi:uncharacterized protein AMSG_08694 [Thecamonas trahens ATCC 50062]|uniref:PSI domain-containing protein n=1 Tax=Thecamonas trahens ATCC 50062 TaxID=461836 RepID=A0A0L0DN11_THETB|nr:hypothetical protein AMSG_08694 [Thecamonas trahens ATCC 50062]KNC52803.1 hypothetical protein AMSG_08694 [Thecamonas trahens ATCC 50062]|eukprot:XP_013755112.1 hypothetical protein AMSG_08694 [Thecamonas trahens ATCC 50062]